MLKTTYNEFLSELREVPTAFGVTDDISIEITAKTNDEEEQNFSVFVDIEDKSFAYRYRLRPLGDLERKRYTKRFLKLSLYKALSSFLEKTLPWGSLTGIRPTKLAYQSIETFGEFERYFIDELLVSPEKTQLVADILQAQKPYYQKDDNISDFFVGIPFCPSRCAYCSFLSNEIGKEKHLGEYVDALCREIEGSKPLVKNLRSVYVGGGTPVALDNKSFEKILDAIGDVNVEYTVEAGRPDAINEDNLKIMKEHNVTRICVNPQTFCDETLERMGRRHTADDIFKKYELAKKFGFDVNMDFIAGLIGENFETFKSTIKTAISLDPEDITVHTLALKHGSRLKESISRLSDGSAREFVDFAHDELYKAGYRPYYLYRQKYMADNLENTGYAKPGKECVYNIDIMEEISQIIACGANAVSKRVFGEKNRIERLGAPKDIATYIQKVETVLSKKFELYGLPPTKK